MSDDTTKEIIPGSWRRIIRDEVWENLERELAEVTKQRDELVRAIRKHKQTLAFTLDYCDVELYKALEELEEGGAA